MNDNRRHLVKNVHRVFGLLLNYPDGLASKDLWQQLADSHPNGNGNGHSHASVPSFEDLSFACIGPIKAGWLQVAGNRWCLSESGRDAYRAYADPQQLMLEAGKRSKQGWLAVHFPRAYAAAGKTKDQLTSEVKTIRRIGITRLVQETFGKPHPWQTVLPVQSPRDVYIDGIEPNQSIADYLKCLNAPYSEGSHAIYLSPQNASVTSFAKVLRDYPDGAGLKIMKTEGSVDEGNYIAGRAKGDSSIQLGAVHGHRHLTLVANLLNAKQLGARLYDLVNLRCGERVWAAYVVEDVGQRVPSLTECEQGISELRKLHAEGVLLVIVPEGFDDEEFECPTCCNNVLLDSCGRFRYIDFQNFLLGDYENFLTHLATEAAEQTHFGDTAMLRGGRYLYQSIPGVRLPAKRSVASRMKTINRLLAEAGVSVKDRVVLDVGCNIGMMMAEYLRLGAKWCHGWDRATTVLHTEKILLALGCTRFSTTGADITKSQPLSTDVPPHVESSLEGCVVSYLAIRGHLEWLDELARVPWAFMIYEGHEGERRADFDAYLAELRKLTAFTLGPVGTYVDGDSDERTVAILLKQ